MFTGKIKLRLESKKKPVDTFFVVDGVIEKTLPLDSTFFKGCKISFCEVGKKPVITRNNVSFIIDCLIDTTIEKVG